MRQSAEHLVRQEPWRQNRGQPKSILDPTWEGVERPTCAGYIEYEMTEAGTTGWWFCTDCGYCGSNTVTTHQRVQHPVEYFLHSVLFFYRRRIAQGAPVPVATQQALFTAGMAIRYAATLPPNQLVGYVEQLTIQ